MDVCAASTATAAGGRCSVAAVGSSCLPSMMLFSDFAGQQRSPVHCQADTKACNVIAWTWTDIKYSLDQTPWKADHSLIKKTES